ncbi:MAG: SDR family NAD(P)-dependent oxidoreductase, partial [Methyloligellaceae bacterium]
MMEDILAPFTEQVCAIKLSAPKIPFISNVSGSWITPAEATDPGYWARHLRQTVRFADGANELLQDSARVLLEVGPGQTLAALAKMCWQERQRNAAKKGETRPAIISSTRHPQEAQADLDVLLTALGKLWLAGVKIDWPKFYAGERRLRVPLPRYWVSPQRTASDARPQTILHKKTDIADWFYAPCWTRSVPPAYLKTLPKMGQKSCWLIFQDAAGMGEKMAEHLERGQQTVVSVTVGSAFRRHDDRSYSLDPSARADYEALLEALQAEVHLWSWELGVESAEWGMRKAESGNATPNSQLQIPNFESASGFFSMLFLTQALGNRNITEAVQISVMTGDTQKVTGDEVISPQGATVAGICRVLPLEQPNIGCRQIDLSFSQEPDAQLIAQLVAECAAHAPNNLVAYRDDVRWIQTWQPVYLPKREAIPQRLHKSGVYLVTGGLGGIGLALAEYLAQTVQAKLVLTGRSEMPSEDAWDRWLSAHDEADSTSMKIRKLRKLKALGAEVMVARADVADLQQMQETIRQAEERFGRIHGVIHAAGIAGGGMLQNKAPEAAMRVMAPKVKGTLVLAALLKDAKPDFIVLCSSINSILAGFGQGDYCGANAFLDAFAQRTDGNSPFTVAINWDTWAEVGMAVNTEIP